ncbi:MAG: hypothetical protein ACRDON_01090 [Gaiellaceae bacterium]
MHRLGAITVLLAASLALAACSTSELGGSELPLEEDFSGDCEWPDEESAQSIIGCFGETYRIIVKGDYGQLSLYGLGTNTDALHFEADGRVVRGPGPPFAVSRYLNYGVGCWADDDRGYVLSVSADGSSAILRDQPDTDRFELLAEERNATRERRTGRLAADCVARDGVTTLVLSVDGEEVLVARDENGYEAFGSVGFLLDASEEAEVRFDEAAARELSAEAATAARAREPTPPSAGLPLRDDFSNPASGWATAEEGFVVLKYEAGGYRMRLRAGGPQWSLFRTGEQVDGIAVAASARKEAGPQSTAFGVACYAGGENGYVFVLSPQGGYEILKEGGPELLRVLEEGPAPPLGAGGKPVRLDATCVGSKDGAARLTFEANGRRVATVRDPRGLETFTTVGFYVFAGEAGADVVFDDLAARELD